MQWEVEDYRKKPPTPSWSEWQVPRGYRFDYVGKMAFWCLLFPFILFGTIFLPVNLLIQILLLDYIIYSQYKNTGII